jgi:SnoaL-like domain
MELKELVKEWFRVWEDGDYQNIPVAENFRHTSPYGTIDGKGPYLTLVESNKDKFLGNHIELHDEIYDRDRACVRYTITNNDFTMEVSEWFFKGNDQIQEIVAYYNIEGEISEARKLSKPK